MNEAIKELLNFRTRLLKYRNEVTKEAQKDKRIDSEIIKAHEITMNSVIRLLDARITYLSEKDD